MTPRELRNRRLALGWSHNEMAGVLGVPATKIADWESSNGEVPGGRTLNLLLRGFERYHGRVELKKNDARGE
ncbi:MAG TPA: helix-turn-helix domain-containing protein [Thermoanaerobaculia bacterium]|nr:helix-turn-helix domain-containing protein [Thermoanaerobaculia bacterium]